MKLLVDEMPYSKDDCLFAEPRWSEDEETWVTYCKFSSERCDLDEKQCSCLLRSEPQTDEEYINNLPWTEVGNGEQTDEPRRDCFLCKWIGEVDVCGRCRNRNLFAEADTEPKPKTEPQTDWKDQMWTEAIEAEKTEP